MLMIQDVLGPLRVRRYVGGRTRIDCVGAEDVQRNTTRRNRRRIAADDVDAKNVAGPDADSVDRIGIVLDVDVFGRVAVVHPPVDVADFPIVLAKQVALEACRDAERVAIRMIAAVEDVVRTPAETDRRDAARS